MQAPSTAGGGAACSCCSAAARRSRRCTRRASWASRPSASLRPPSPVLLSLRLCRCKAVLHQLLWENACVVAVLACYPLTHGCPWPNTSAAEPWFRHLCLTSTCYWQTHSSGRNYRSNDISILAGLSRSPCSCVGAGCPGGRAIQQTPMSRRAVQTPLADSAPVWQ